MDEHRVNGIWMPWDEVLNTNKKQETYLRFLFSKNDRQQAFDQVVDGRDTRYAKSRVPDGAYAFMFYEVKSMNGQYSNGDAFDIPYWKENVIRTYFLGGQVYNFQEFQRKVPNAGDLIKQFEQEGYQKVIHCSDNVWRGFRDGDEIIE